MSKGINPEHQFNEAEAALHNYEPALDHFREDVIQGLSRTPKEIPCKYLYDERGSQLFDAICETEEYYPTRTEIQIMREHGADMAEMFGPRCLLIEYGSGSSLKTPLLLDYLEDPAAYVPIDISREHLLRSAARLQDAYPRLPIYPICADYTRPFELPEIAGQVNRRVVYYPGSTIGNFHPIEASEFLAHIAEVAGAGGGLLLGVDLQKSPEIIERAYNDSEGVTAAFNLNLLERINRELGADFQINQFRHRSIYNEEQSRIEMHLISTREQTVHIDGRAFTFQADDSILTECSYKYRLDDFAGLAKSAGFKVERVWTDAQDLFSVQFLSVL